VRPLSLHEDEICEPQTSDPEAAFDRAWVAELIRAAVECLRHRALRDGRELPFRVFAEYDLFEASPRGTYADVAARLGLTSSEVRRYLHDVREDLRAEIRRLVARTVEDATQLEEEWHALFGA
jgi:DNA-directed RNA polymerase specialized sigma24 family protein